MTTILFDLDGTLIDSTEAILESFEVSFKEFGFDVRSDEIIKSFIGHPLELMYEKLGVKDEKIEPIVKSYKKHYRAISREKTTLLPFVKQALEEAKEFAILGVVTTKTKRYSLELLEHMDILKYFSIVIGREDVQNPKPHPEPILKALALLNADKKSAWMIGDTVMDMSSAKDAGIQACGVMCGYGTLYELEKITKNICKNSFEAVKFIGKSSILL